MSFSPFAPFEGACAPGFLAARPALFCFNFCASRSSIGDVSESADFASMNMTPHLCFVDLLYTAMRTAPSSRTPFSKNIFTSYMHAAPLSLGRHVAS